MREPRNSTSEATAERSASPNPRRLCWVVLAGAWMAVSSALAQGPLADSMGGNYVTTKAAAVAQARAQGRLIMLVAGANTCEYCVNFEGLILPQTAPRPIRPLIEEAYVYWYCGQENGCTEAREYDADLLPFGYLLPLVCIINPDEAAPGVFISRSTGVPSAQNFYDRQLNAGVLAAFGPQCNYPANCGVVT